MTPDEVAAIHDRHVRITTAPRFRELVAERERLKTAIRALRDPAPGAGGVIGQPRAVAELEIELAAVRLELETMLRAGAAVEYIA